MNCFKELTDFNIRDEAVKQIQHSRETIISWLKKRVVNRVKVLHCFKRGIIFFEFYAPRKTQIKHFDAQQSGKII